MILRVGRGRGGKNEGASPEQQNEKKWQKVLLDMYIKFCAFVFFLNTFWLLLA